MCTAGLPGGTRAHVLAVTGPATRRVRTLAVTLHPAGERATQQARNLITDIGGQASQATFLTRDRGPDFRSTSGRSRASTRPTIISTGRTAPCPGPRR